MWFGGNNLIKRFNRNYDWFGYFNCNMMAQIDHIYFAEIVFSVFLNFNFLFFVENNEIIIAYLASELYEKLKVIVLIFNSTFFQFMAINIPQFNSKTAPFHINVSVFSLIL